MKFSLLILSPPCADASLHAYQFAKAVAESGHTLCRIFFYQDGVLHVSPKNYPNGVVHLNWSLLTDKYGTDLVVCTTAAAERGIVVNQREADSSSELASQLLPGFTLSGLGQLTEACVDSDRTITFG